MGLSTRVTFRGGLICAMALLLAGAVVGGLTLQGGARTLAVDGLGILAVWMSTGVCWLAVARAGSRRWEALLAAAAVTSLAAGLTYLALMVARSGLLPLVSPGYVVNMLFYPLMLAALVAAVRHDVRGLALPVWLDSAVGCLGAGAVLAVLLSPVLDSIPVGPPSLATGLAIARPMLDMLLIATVAGIAALRGVRMGSRWGLLVVGLMVFAGANIVLALQRTKGIYVAGTPLDAGWPIGLALVAMWVDGAAKLDGSNRHEARSARGRAALVVPAVATMAGLGVLLMGTRTHLSTLAVSLAGVTLLAAMGRTHSAFGRLARMADLRRRAATTDELTGLPNRRVLYAEGRARLVDPQRRCQALLMLDLNKFKEVNDSLGHHAGDQLLIQVAARLNGQLRAGDLLARLGGDEFSVLLQDAGRDQAVDVAVKLCEVLAEPFDLEGITVHSSASIGIALFPDHGLDLSNLLRKADIAMYKAKTSRNGHHVYGTADDADVATRVQMVEELRTALTSNQLVMYYQPKIDLRTGEVHDVEALVRWNHPTQGLLYPDAFLGLVEEAGLLPAMTRLVLEIALDQAAAWHARGQPLTVAVNLSASSLVDTDLPDEVAAMLAARDLPPGALRVEITEQFLMADRARARDILTRLGRHGIQVSVDDFGNGYSSLSCLRDLPIKELKLHHSLILPMIDDARAASLVAATISLAHSLDLRMVAEGVESHTAYTELIRLGCDQAQGYHMSRPIPAAELDRWLSTRLDSGELTDIPELSPSTDLI